jgi:transcriptional regulator with XRE-family HTH domain
MEINFGKILDKVIREQKITGKQLSEVSGVSQPYISEIRKCKSNPSIEMFQTLLNAAEKIKPGSLRLFAFHLAGDLSVQDLAQQLSNQELAQLLIAIAPRVSGSPKEEQWEMASA